MKGKPKEQALCCGPRGELIEGLTSEEKTGKETDGWTCFDKQTVGPELLPISPLCASSPSLSLCL